MSYSVEHVRFTLECDACGLIEKRDLDADQESKGTLGWDTIRTYARTFFCCPTCVEAVGAVLNKRERDLQEAKALQQANCIHEYNQQGFYKKCPKCGRWE